MSLSEDFAALIERLTEWRRFLALYPSAVAAVHDDGTVDLIPDDPTMRGNGGRVLMLSGTAGAWGAPRVGDRVLLFFAGGDPSEPRAIGTDARATEALALASKVSEGFANLDSVFTNWTPVPTDGGTALKAAYDAKKLSAAATGGMYPDPTSDLFGRVS